MDDSKRKTKACAFVFGDKLFLSNNVIFSNFYLSYVSQCFLVFAQKVYKYDKNIRVDQVLVGNKMGYEVELGFVSKAHKQLYYEVQYKSSW